MEALIGCIAIVLATRVGDARLSAKIQSQSATGVATSAVYATAIHCPCPNASTAPRPPRHRAIASSKAVPIPIPPIRNVSGEDRTMNGRDQML